MSNPEGATATKNMSLSEKIDYYSIPEPNSGCWLWLGSLTQKDYGTIQAYGKTQKAHRVSYQVYKGDIPDGMFVCHKCDTPSCVNPDHLFLGTPKDNLRDAVEKGRMSKGEDRHNSKLKEHEVVAIFNDPRPAKTLAIDYNISRRVISKIKRGETWEYLNLKPHKKIPTREKTCAEYAREYMIEHEMMYILTHDCYNMNKIADLCIHTTLVGHDLHGFKRYQALMKNITISKLFFIDCVSISTGRGGGSKRRRAWLIESIDDSARKHNPHLPKPI